MNKREILMKFNGFFSKYDLEGDIEKVSEFIKTIPDRLKESYPLNNELKTAHRFAIDINTYLIMEAMILMMCILSMPLDGKPMKN